jgi:hypothetical protein
MKNKKSEEVIKRAFQRYLEKGESILPIAQQAFNTGSTQKNNVFNSSMRPKQNITNPYPQLGFNYMEAYPQATQALKTNTVNATINPNNSTVETKTEIPTVAPATNFTNPIVIPKQSELDVSIKSFQELQDKQQSEMGVVQTDEEKALTSRIVNGQIQDKYNQFRQDNITGFGGIENSAALQYGLYEFGQGNNARGTLGVAKAGLGFLRDGLSAYGAGKANKYTQDQYQDKQYGPGSNMYRNFQQGGEMQSQDPQQGEQQQQMMQQVAQMLQQGTSPEQVVQQLAEMGMPQEQALQVVQQVIQQIQSQQQPQMAQQEEQMMQEPQMMQQGGQSGDGITGNEALTGEYTTEVSPNADKNVNVEKNEWIKDNETGEVTKAVGDTHKNGGIDVDLKNHKIISNFTKLGAGNAKYFSKEYDLKLKSNDTFAKIMETFNKKSGISKLTEEEIALTKQMGNILTTDNPDENSQDLNAKFLTGKMQELLKKQAPLKEQRSNLFEDVFNKQEMIPKKGNGELIMKEGGMTDPMLMQMAKQYGIDPARAQELLNSLPVAQGGANTWYSNNPPLFMQQNVAPRTINSTNLRSFTKEPVDINALPYTPREDSTDELWKGDNYGRDWIPLVENTMADPAKASRIEGWLLSSDSKYAENIKQQLTGLTGRDRTARITQLATDGKPGPYHNAFIDAIKEVEKQDIAVKESTAAPQEEVVNNPEKIRQNPKGGYNFGFQPLYMPPSSTQPVFLGNAIAPNIEVINQTAEPSLVEAERQRAAASGRYEGLSPEQAAAMQAQDFAQTQNATNAAIANAEGANQQAQNAGRAQQAGYDFKADMMNQNYRNQYEQKVFAGQNAYEENLQNYFNKAYNMPGQLAELNRNKAAAYNSMNDNYKVGNGEVEFNPTESAYYNSLPSNLQKDFLNMKKESNKIAKMGGSIKKNYNAPYGE